MLRIKPLTYLFLLPTFIIAATFLSPYAFASLGEYVVTFDTHEVQLPSNAAVRIRYSCSALISHPTMGSFVSTNEGHTWEIRLQNGQLLLDVYLPIISGWVNATKELPIGSGFEIPVTTGISARVSITARASLSVVGDAQLSSSYVTLDTADAETFMVTTGESSYSNIAVTMAFSFQVGVGVTAATIQIPIADIGSFNALPTISEGATLVNWGLIMWPLLLVIFLFTMAIVAYVIERHENRTKKQLSRMAPSPNSETGKTEIRKEEGARTRSTFCIYCGQALSSNAVYCKNWKKSRMMHTLDQAGHANPF